MPKIKVTRLIVFVLVFLLACFGVIQFLENQTTTLLQKYISQLPPQLSVNAESIDFSLFKNKLVLKNIMFEDNNPNNPSHYAISEIVVYNPHVKALNPETPGLPYIADKILIKNIVATSPLSKTAIKEYQIEDWQQNLGKLAQAYIKGNLNQEFWDASLEFQVGNAIAKDQTTEFYNTQGYPIMRVTLASSQLTGTKKGMVNFVLEDVDVHYAQVLNLSFAKIEVNDLLLPSPTAITSFMNFTELAEDKWTETEIENLIFKILADYKVKAPASSMLFSNIEISIRTNTNEKLLLLGVKEIKQNLHSMPYVYGLEVTDFVMPTDSFDFPENLPYFSDLSDLKDVLGMLELKGLKINFKAKLRVPKDFMSFSAELSSDIVNVNKQDLNLKLDFQESLENITAANMGNYLADSSLTTFKYIYEDKGLIPRSLLFFVGGSMEDVQPALEEITAEINSLARRLEIESDFIVAAKEMLNQPGTIEFNLAENATVPLRGFIGTFILKPNEVPLRVTYTSHGKSIIQAVDELK